MNVSKTKLIALRKERGWSQNTLAKISGLGERTIQRIEKEGVCSLESAMSLASVYEISPKDIQSEEPTANTLDAQQLNNQYNWGGLIGMLVLAFCALFVIELTAKYTTWEIISFTLIIGLSFTFSAVSHGIHPTLSSLAATWWIVKVPPKGVEISIKIALVKSMRDYAYIIGIVSSLVCGLTIAVHTQIDSSYLANYLTYAIRPFIYGVLVAELWFRPLKMRLEYILKTHSRPIQEGDKP